MAIEQRGGKNFLKRLINRDGVAPKGDAFAATIVPLRPEQREEYPHVIYELESRSPYDHALVLASHEAMVNAQFPIAVDLEGKGFHVKVVVRTSTEDRHNQAAESALFLGLSEATRRRMAFPYKNTRARQASYAGEYQARASYVAGELLNGLTSKPELSEAFRKYYGGLRWSLDQERFVRELFVHGTNYDQGFLDNNLNGRHLGSLVYLLEADMPYDQRKDWSRATPAEIFEKFPDLDYHRLQDEEFRKTPEGQKLLAGYTKLCGEITSAQNKRDLERNITSDGREMPRPRIPLSRHPIIEALVVDELSIDKPKPKYNFGPRDLTEIVLDSDSQPAHESLITAINTRLPKENRRVIDGPDEFEHKHGNIWSVLTAYQEAYRDNQRRGLLRRDLVRVMDAFTGEGEIAASVRQENILWRERSKSWSSDGMGRDMTEVYKVKDIISDLIKIALTAPDPEISGRAENLVAQFLPENEHEQAEPDGLSLKRSDLMLVLIDALKYVSIGSKPAVFKRTGTRVFGDIVVGEELQGFAETEIRAFKMRSTPEVFLAAAGLRKFGLSFGDEKSPEEVEARRRFEELVRPANQLAEGQRQAKNQLLFSLLEKIANSGLLAQGGDAAELFQGFVRRIKFSDYNMRQLPQEYQTLIDLANNPELTERQKNDILWQVEDQFDFVGSEAAHLLIPVILDMYQVSLGPVDAVRLPTEITDHGLAAAVTIVRKHGREMFKSASQEQLETLANYAKGVHAHAEQIASGAMLENEEVMERLDIADLKEWQEETMKNLSDVMRQLKSIEEHYLRYLRIEAVKVFPHVYYPWLLEQFVPFWQKMQWEVGPGNRPSREISELYRVLENHARKMFAIRKPEEYTEGFDAIKEGHVDSLLKEGYERMVISHDIQYNSTVWQEGLSFMHAAVAYMPPVLLEQIRTKYPNSNFADYLEKEHARWNEKETTIT